MDRRADDRARPPARRGRVASRGTRTSCVQRDRRLVTWVLCWRSFVLIVNALVGENGYLAVAPRATASYRDARATS